MKRGQLGTAAEAEVCRPASEIDSVREWQIEPMPHRGGRGI